MKMNNLMHKLGIVVNVFKNMQYTCIVYYIVSLKRIATPIISYSYLMCPF